jgi:hypothetical protein
MTLLLPRYVIAKSLASGRTAFYFNVPKKYRDLGCTLPRTPLGTVYALACGEDGDGGRAASLNAAFDEWNAVRHGVPVTRERVPIYGTIRWLFQEYRRSKAYLEKVAPRSRPDYERTMQLIEGIVTKKGDKLGDRQIRSVTPISADKVYEKILAGPDGERPRQAEKVVALCWRAWRVVHRFATENDPFAVKTDGDDPYNQVVALPWFASEIKPIYEGKVQIDSAKSASALSQFKKTCQALLPQMTTKDLRMAQCILGAVGEIECEVKNAIKEAKAAAETAKRIKWEAKYPEKAKENARKKAQGQAMQDDYEEAKGEARESGETWSEIKDEWIEDWIANNWGPEEEAEFEAEFKDQWITDHGTAFPEAEKAAA